MESIISRATGAPMWKSIASGILLTTRGTRLTAVPKGRQFRCSVWVAAHSDAPCVGRAADVLGILPGDPGVVPDIFNVVSTHISLHVRLPSLPFLHTFCTLSARAAQRSFSGEYAWSDLLSDLSMVVA